jgi:hypothetical protein
MAAIRDARKHMRHRDLQGERNRQTNPQDRPESTSQISGCKGNPQASTFRLDKGIHHGGTEHTEYARG